MQESSQDGVLQPAVFPGGVDAAIVRHQTASAASPSAATPPALPRHLHNGASVAPEPSAPPISTGQDLPTGATPMYPARGAAEAAQLHSDREYAMTLAHEAAAGLPPAVVATAPPHGRVMADRLQRARHRGQNSYAYVSPTFFFALLAGAHTSHVACSGP